MNDHPISSEMHRLLAAAGWDAGSLRHKQLEDALDGAKLRIVAVSHPDAGGGVREAFVSVLASLAAAISLLERMPKAKKAAPSDTMFAIMLDDYRKALETGRTALSTPPAAAESNASVEAIELAYGLLWVVNCDRSTRGGNALYLARKALLEQLDRAGQGRGISAARKVLKDEEAGCGGIGYSVSGRVCSDLDGRTSSRSGDTGACDPASGGVASLHNDGHPEGAARPDGLSVEARLREAILASIDMIENCAGVPTNPDSLPQMVKVYLQQAISVGDEAKKSEPPHWREVEMMRLIDLLRSEEGDSVTILCDNPDFNGQPNCAVVCNGSWTDWQDRRFAQDTLLDALSAAMIEYKRPREAKKSEGGKKEAFMTEDQIKHMVNRFLGWKLPANFNPDNGVSFNPIAGENGPHPFKREPSGTNLFDATQATEMVRYMIDGMPIPSSPTAERREIVARALMEKWPGDYAWGDETREPNELAFETADAILAALDGGAGA